MEASGGIAKCRLSSQASKFWAVFAIVQIVNQIPTLYYINKVSQLLFAIKGCDNHYCVCHFLFFFFSVSLYKGTTTTYFQDVPS